MTLVRIMRDGILTLITGLAASIGLAGWANVSAEAQIRIHSGARCSATPAGHAPTAHELRNPFVSLLPSHTLQLP